jgi:endonuclease V-like protein UPF0215 family
MSSQAIGTGRGFEVVSLPGNGSQRALELPVAAFEEEMPDFHEVLRAARDHLVSREGIRLGRRLLAGPSAGHSTEHDD